MTKLNIIYSKEKYLLYRTLKEKSDYDKMHLKATTITPTGYYKYKIKHD